MKVSIITACYNSAKVITDCLESVKNQDYKDIEHIVIDGLSNDNTLDIVKKYNPDILVSEKDGGLYQALNKGVGLATGDIVAFLHSDDVYYSCSTISNIVEAFKKSDADAVYSDLEYVSSENINRCIRYWQAGTFNLKKLRRGWMPPHPSFFVKRNVYQRAGNFNESYSIAADYDFMMRVLNKEKISVYYLNETTVKMRVGGESNKSIKNLIRKSKEDYRAARTNNVGGITTVIFKNLRKIKQFILRQS